MAEEAQEVTDINVEMVNKIEQNLNALPGSPMEAEKFTIFRVPTAVRKKNKELYEPRMVAIGPYYHGKKRFQAMEKHKWRYLRDFLSRNSRNNVENYVNRVMELELQARRCYFEEVELGRKEFVMMLLLDSCFIIEFLIKWNYQMQDPVFDVGWTLPFIRGDFLMLENQIPFFVIQQLFDLLIGSGSRNPICQLGSLLDLLLEYLSEGREERPLFILTNEIQHLLHLYHLCYVCPPNLDNLPTANFFSTLLRWLNPVKLGCLLLSYLRKKSPEIRSPRTIPSATELQEAGMTLKQKKSNNILDITYRNGIIEIPFVSIQDTRKARLMNLVMFEQCCGKEDRNLTSYACFMGCIMKTPRDVAVLQDCGILENLLASDDELVKFFNWLSDCTSLDYETHYLAGLFRDVKEYYDSEWHRWRAMLKRDYFNNPWAIISFIAAVVLLIFTFLQTFYTIYPYYHPRK